MPQMWDPNDFINFLASGADFSDIRGKVVGRDEFESCGRDILVDTCFTMDTGMYETAVCVNDDPLVVVEEYNTQGEAEKGHEKWVETCSKRSFTLDSVQIPEIRIYE